MKGTVLLRPWLKQVAEAWRRKAKAGVGELGARKGEKSDFFETQPD